MYKSEQAAIQALLRFRVENDSSDCSNKQWAKLAERAVKLFVRRYSTMPTCIRELEAILESKDLRSKCITLPLGVLEAPVTPLTFLQIWRWPGVSAGQLLGEPHCKYKLSRILNVNANANDEVCINPYHYKLAIIEQPSMRVYAPIGTGTPMHVASNDFSNHGQLELNGAITAALETYSGGTPINVELARTSELCNTGGYQTSSNAVAANATSPYGNFSANPFNAAQQNANGSGALYGSGSANPQFPPFTRPESVTPVHSPASTITYYAGCGPRSSLDDDVQMATPLAETFSFPANQTQATVTKSSQPTATISYTALPQSAQCYPTVQNATSYFAAPTFPQSATSTATQPQTQSLGQNGSVTYGEVAYVEPNCWCSVQYYEFLCHLGETFHCGSPTLTIDGFCDPNAPECFCLGRISNPNREPEAEHVRRQIQRGVKLYYVAGEVYLENLSENAVFVQSSNMNMRNHWPLCAVCKVGAGMTAQLFSNSDFAAQLAHNVNEGYESVFKLTYMCVIRMSFVKGWGAKYRRQTLSSVPCWVEIRLNGALQWLDRVLRQMGSPGLQTSTGSIK